MKGTQEVLTPAPSLSKGVTGLLEVSDMGSGELTPLDTKVRTPTVHLVGSLWAAGGEPHS